MWQPLASPIYLFQSKKKVVRQEETGNDAWQKLGDRPRHKTSRMNFDRIRLSDSLSIPLDVICRELNVTDTVAKDVLVAKDWESYIGG